VLIVRYRSPRSEETDIDSRLKLRNSADQTGMLGGGAAADVGSAAVNNRRLDSERCQSPRGCILVRGTRSGHGLSSLSAKACTMASLERRSVFCWVEDRSEGEQKLNTDCSRG
jgi:hypothetical protein